jgi:hypothetical protein
MTIAKFTRAYVRHYCDSNQVTAYLEWIDRNGKTGRTESPVRLPWQAMHPDNTSLYAVYGLHMGALFAKAICHGLPIERETW